MIDEQSSASEHDYASDRSAIGAGGVYLVQSCDAWVVVDIADTGFICYWA